MGLKAIHKRQEDLSYEEIRSCLAPEYRRLPDMYIEQIITRAFGETVDPEDIEGLFGDIGNFVTGAAKTVAKALPTVLPAAGTIVGTAFGGPVGGAIGGALGSAAGSAVGSAVGGKPSQILPAIGKAATSAIGATQQAPIGNSSAIQLLQTLLQPQVMQGLKSMALGQAGKQSIPVAGTQVPLSAFANLIGTLANQAMAEQHLLHLHETETIPSYILNSEGFPIVDPAVPEQRAEALLNLLRQENLDEGNGSLPVKPHLGHLFQVQEDLDHYYDMLELASLYEELEA